MNGVFEFIELYLKRDLLSMRSLRSDDGLGKCGYQMMTSICSGCEILGSLEMNEVTSSGGDKKFEFFLENHLSEYASSWKILYYFIRHRVAHDFITPPGIVIRLMNDRERHLGLMDDCFVVDAYVFMDDFISAYEKIKKRYNEESAYKNLLDKGDELFVRFIKKKSEDLNKVISEFGFKRLEYPNENNSNDKNKAVPSGAAFAFDYSNITRIPDDMLEKMSLITKDTIASGASGSVIKTKDIKPLK